MPWKFEYDHLLHPTTLDTCIQGSFAPTVGSTEGRELASITSVYISADVPKGAESELCGYSTLNKQGFSNLVGSVVMSDKSWSEPLVVIKGLNYKKCAHSSGETVYKKQPWEVKKICSNLVWKADLDHVQQSHAAEVFAPGTKTFSQTITDSTNTCNSMIAKWLELGGHKRPYQRILEVGGGSASLTLQALEALGGQNGATPTFSRYVFSDHDTNCCDRARELLKAWEDRIEYKRLDVDSNPFEQYFEKESFDVVLAGHVSPMLDIEAIRSETNNDMTRHSTLRRASTWPCFIAPIF